MKYKLLFQPGKIGSLKLKNRIVMPPMVRNYATDDGMVTQRYIDHIYSIAKGGVGMMVLEASYITHTGKGFVNQLGIHRDDTIAGLHQLAKTAHKSNAAIGVQLYHGGRQASSKTMGSQPVAPSPIPDPTVNEVPRELTQAEIKEIIQLFADAARRAKQADMDFVELHGAHGYLITQFLSPFSNRRNDSYGGSFKNRMKFLLEVYQAVRDEVGKDFPITLRLSGDESVPGGLTIQDTVKIAKEMESLGVDAFHISAGNYASYAKGLMIPPMATKEAPLTKMAKAVKKAVKVPVIAVAKLRLPEVAEKVLKNKEADFVAVGRSLLADPQWPNKIQQNKISEINNCIACNQGCISRLFAQQDVWCTVNPKTSREAMFNKPLGKSLKVIIVGAGPAGLSAAREAVERGHMVTLYEKKKKIGGQLIAAGAAPYRQGWNELRDFLMREMKRLKVDIKIGVEFTPELAASLKPDAIIWAAGSDAKMPKINGIDQKHVISSRDLLEGKGKVGKRVIIAGGGCAGAQTAEFLASKGRKVTIVEATGEIALDAPIDERMLLLGRLDKYEVKIFKNSKVMDIQKGAVIIENGTVSKKLPTDSVVICLGGVVTDGFLEKIKESVKNVKVVGDASQVRRVTEAMMEGAIAALEL